MVALRFDQTSKKSRHTVVSIALNQVVPLYFGSLLPLSHRYWSYMPIYPVRCRIDNNKLLITHKLFDDSIDSKVITVLYTASLAPN